MPWVLVALVAALGFATSAAGQTPQPEQGKAKTIIDGLRNEGDNLAVWIPPAFYVQIEPAHVQQKPVNIVLHFVSENIDPRSSYRKTRILQRYVRGESGEHWYAVAGAGSGTLALLPGAPVEPEGLRLQKRAKIGSAQLGMARDIGTTRLTLGYLRHENDRDQLVPYYTNVSGQNLAAMTLTLKH